MLFFKHLYLICNIFYNTLYYSYVLHSTTFYALVSDQTEEKKETKYYPGFSSLFGYNRLGSVSSPFW